jgi:hypothetical protein
VARSNDRVVPVVLVGGEQEHAELGAIQAAGDRAALVGGDELEKEPHCVAVAAHRRRPKSLDGDQMVDEEGLQQRPEGRVSLIVASAPRARCGEAASR